MTKRHLDTLAPFLASALPRLLRRLRHEIKQPRRPAPEWDDVAAMRSTPGQLTALGIVVTTANIPMQALSKQLSVTPATATTAVKRLMAADLVERHADDSDWRVVSVRPTDKGRRVFNYYLDLREQAMRDRLARLPAHQLEALTAAIPALQALLDG